MGIGVYQSFWPISLTPVATILPTRLMALAAIFMGSFS